MDIKKAIESIPANVDTLADDALRIVVVQLLNIIEAQAGQVKAKTLEVQNLRDENNRLKGEQGKPKIRKQTQGDVSSEKERNGQGDGEGGKPRKKKKSKKCSVQVNRVEMCSVDKDQLPDDIVFKGYQSVVIQDIIIQTDNVEFKKEIYYSPSQNKTFIASLPEGYAGSFGPGIQSLVLSLHHDAQMSESAIHNLLATHGVMISSATISRMLTAEHDIFHEDKDAIVQAGLGSSTYQHIDDTGARVAGKNYYTHILSSPWYTAYFTKPNKTRLTVLEILTQGALTFCFDEQARDMMKEMGLSKKTLTFIEQSGCPANMNRSEVDDYLSQWFEEGKHATSRQIILEASAIVAYQRLPHAVPVLLADDAPQFKQITEYLALCWIHDGRHYKKLSPVIATNRKKLESFLTRYWGYYRQLLAYKEAPDDTLASSLNEQFDQLFTTKTDYDALDQRIAKTLAKKSSLLRVLRHPELPLHNNDAELGARKQARYRDISYHTMSDQGTRAKDTFMTLKATAVKLGVNLYNYIFDRVSKKFAMPSMADLIKQRSQHDAYDTG